MKMNADALQYLARARTDEYGQDAKFASLFVEKWLPATQVDTGGAPMSLLAPVHPEVYVFGPRIASAVTCADRVIKLLSSDNETFVESLVRSLRQTYQDEFGDINDYDWEIYRRYLARNRLNFTTRVDRVYDVKIPVPTDLLNQRTMADVSFDVMLQEMMYYELLGPNLLKSAAFSLPQGARRHAAFVTAWRLRA